MGLLNSNQILPGARTQAGEKTYTLAGVKTRPTSSATGDTLTFAGGTLELEGKDYSLDGLALDFGNLGTLVAPGQQFLVAAVAKYNEPLNQSAAEAAGLNYYVERSGNDFLAKNFLPSDVAAAVAAAGGVTALSQRVYMGSASASDITVFNTYTEAAQRLYDPRYSIFPLAPIGVELVLAQVSGQDNSPKHNALLGKTAAEFTLLKSQLPLIYRERLVMTAAQAATRYASAAHLIVSAYSYASVSDAQSDISGTTVASNNFGGLTGTVPVAVIEYTYPSNMPLGQVGTQDKVLRFLAKEDSSYLGRINPIYLYNESVAARFGQQPANRITLYGDPCSLVKVTLGGTQGSLTMTISDAYEMMIA